MASLTDSDKARVRYYLGYPNTDRAMQLAHGVPFTAEYNFVLEPMMDNLLDVALPKVQQLLGVLDDIETKMVEAQDRLAAQSLGDLRLRTGRAGESEPDLLWKERLRWARKLAAIFAVDLGPWFDDGGTRTGSIARNIG